MQHLLLALQLVLGHVESVVELRYRVLDVTQLGSVLGDALNCNEKGEDTNYAIYSTSATADFAAGVAPKTVEAILPNYTHPSNYSKRRILYSLVQPKINALPQWTKV